MKRKESRGKNNRYRLSTAEEKWLLQLRQIGTLPTDMTILSDKNTAKLDARYRHLKRLYDAALKELDIAQESLDILEKLKSSTVNKQQIILKPIKSNRNKSQSIAFSIASDWHFEEEVESNSVNNLNKFTVQIAKQRTKRFFEKTLYLVELMRGETQVDQLVLALLGDLISGTIHDDLIEMNQLSTTQTIMELVNIIKSGIDFLVKEGKFKNIHIPCAFGNHGRTTQKKRIATGHRNSFEVLMYQFLAMIYDKHPIVTFQIPLGYHVFVKPFNKYLIRFHHGDAIRYGGGVGGISIPVNKAIAQWNRSKKAYMDVFGHFHQTKDGGDWLSSGSLIGYNAFALSIKADYEPPMQTFFMIEKDKGKTFVAPIILEDLKV